MNTQYSSAASVDISAVVGRFLDDSLRIALASFNAASEVSVCEEAVRLICEMLRVPMGSVWISDPDTNRVRLLFEGGDDVLLVGGTSNKLLVEETVLEVLGRSVLVPASLSSGSDELPSRSDNSGVDSTSLHVPEPKSTKPAVLAIPSRRATGASFVLCACAPNPRVFSEPDRVLLLMIASRTRDALDRVDADMRANTSHQQLLTFAELANPGLVAMSFVHDARHTLHTINALVSSLVYLIPASMRSTSPAKEIVDSLIPNPEKEFAFS